MRLNNLLHAPAPLPRGKEPLIPPGQEAGQAPRAVAYPGIFSGGGVQQIQLRTEDREDGDLGAVAPYSGVLEATVIWYKKFSFI